MHMPPLAQAIDFAGSPATTPAPTLVRGPFRYFHYACDAFNDTGWGCGFRTVQTILSWLSPENVPSIPELQGLLGHATDGSSWIGVQDAVVILDELADSRVKVLTLASGRDAAAHLAALEAHFDAGGGPCMIGGGTDVYSKTVVGVSRVDGAHS